MLSLEPPLATATKRITLQQVACLLVAVNKPDTILTRAHEEEQEQLRHQFIFCLGPVEEPVCHGVLSCWVGQV